MNICQIMKEKLVKMLIKQKKIDNKNNKKKIKYKII